MSKKTDDNFKLLRRRIVDSNDVSDMEQIKDQLAQIKDSVICVGVGGSSVVSEYASKIFNRKNNCIAVNRDPRDLLYEKILPYKNIFSCSYSGKNFGVKISLSNKLQKYLFTHNQKHFKNVSIIRYDNSVETEKSFISLAATLIPMSILLNYYLSGEDFNTLIEDMFDNIRRFDFEANNTFEIMSGIETSVSAKYLQSTMIEAGLATPVVHSKYDYCHGKTTLAFNNRNTLIYLQSNFKDLDKKILDEATNLYKEIIILDSNYNDNLIDDFNLTLKAMYLTKYLAELQHKDLSAVKYAPAVKQLYHFKGSM